MAHVLARNGHPNAAAEMRRLAMLEAEFLEFRSEIQRLLTWRQLALQYDKERADLKTEVSALKEALEAATALAGGPAPQSRALSPAAS
ncbi:MAG: hypothetical protein JO370_00725 [Paucibacter sp.]|nr:hypothetical protein [Roseateles sp.]